MVYRQGYFAAEKVVDIVEAGAMEGTKRKKGTKRRKVLDWRRRCRGENQHAQK